MEKKSYCGKSPTSENKGDQRIQKKKDAQSGTSDYTIELQGDSEVTVRLEIRMRMPVQL